MNIIVCIKQVPDTTEIKIDPVKGTLIRDGVPSIMNPDDKGGLELALRLKDQFGANVTVVSMGPPQADVIMREAFAMGADRAILLSDRKFAGSDTLATSYALAGLCRSLDYDLIIAGRQAIDGDTAQVGPEMAEHLGLPQVSYVADAKLLPNGNLLFDLKICHKAELLKGEHQPLLLHRFLSRLQRGFQHGTLREPQGPQLCSCIP